MDTVFLLPVMRFTQILTLETAIVGKSKGGKMVHYLNNSIKRALLLHIIPFVLLIGPNLYSQTIEKFTDNSDGDKSFSEGGLNFYITGQLEVDYRAGWGFDDDYFISNFANSVTGGGTVGSFTNPTNNFKVHQLYLITLNASELVEQYNNILIRGKLDGETQFTHTVYYNQINMTSTNNYYTFIDLSSYSLYTLDELEFIIDPYGTNDIVYLMIDDFQFEADASLPVELVSFSAFNNSNAVKLEWSTTSEIDNLGFIIERKSESTNWKQIASYQSDNRLAGQGTISSPSQYTFTDNKISTGMDYTYRLSEVSTNGDVIEIGSTTVSVSAIPQTTQLFAAYPNPFNPSTNIKYNLANDSHVTMAVYDLLGRNIKSLVNQHQSAGQYSIQWDGSTDAGVTAPSGTYLLRMQAGNTTQMQKVMFIK